MTTKPEEFVEVQVQMSQSLDAILHDILNQALLMIGAESGCIMLVNQTHGILQIKARLGKPRRTQPGRTRSFVYPLNRQSVAAWVVQNKKPYLCNDVDTDKEFYPSQSGRNFLSLLSVPVIYDGKVIAVINADAEKKNYFTMDSQNLVEQVAKTVAPLLAERVSILTAFSEVSVELTKLPRSGGVKQLLQKIAHAAVRSLGADLVSVYEYDHVQDKFLVDNAGPTRSGHIWTPEALSVDVKPGDAPWILVKERTYGFFAEAKEQTFLTHTVDSPRSSQHPPFIEREGIESTAALLLPFRAGAVRDEAVVGAMFVNYRTHHEFSIDEVSALANLADLAAVAILNARQEGERRIKQMKLAESISANFAHRMSNLAGPCRVAAQILKGKIDPQDEIAQRQLDRIQRQADLLFQLVERLKKPFGGDYEELSPIDLRDLIRRELDVIQTTCPNLTIIRNIEDDLPLVSSIEFQLQQAFHDILNNAIEAMSDKDSQCLQVKAWHNRSQNHVEVEIDDNGCGIPVELRERLFVAGVTTKADKVGIGLWWCRTFLQATGGDIVLSRSQIGEGSQFNIKVPCMPEKGVPISDSTNVIEESDFLIVDDHPAWLEQFVDMVSHDSHSYKVARSYSEAAHLLEENHFRLAIIDVRLDEFDVDNEDGLCLLEYMNRLHLKTKAFLVTGHSVPSQQERATSMRNCISFMRKQDFDFDKFRELVDQVVSGT